MKVNSPQTLTLQKEPGAGLKVIHIDNVKVLRGTPPGPSWIEKNGSKEILHSGGEEIVGEQGQEEEETPVEQGEIEESEELSGQETPAEEGDDNETDEQRDGRMMAPSERQGDSVKETAKEFKMISEKSKNSTNNAGSALSAREHARSRFSRLYKIIHA